MHVKPVQTKDPFIPNRGDQVKQRLAQAVARFSPVISILHSMYNGDQLTQVSVSIGLGTVLCVKLCEEQPSSEAKIRWLEKKTQIALYTIGLSFSTMHHIQSVAQVVMDQSLFAQQAVAIQTGKSALALTNAAVSLSRSSQCKAGKEIRKIIRSLAFSVPVMALIESSVILVGSSAMQSMQDPEKEEVFQTVGMITALASGVFLAKKYTEHFAKEIGNLLGCS